MSVRTMARVWEHSRFAGSELVMLLAIADFADDDGQAFPAVPTLARKCRTTPRHANRLLAALRKSRELEIRVGEGPHGTNLYRVLVGLTGTSPLTHSSPLTGVSPLTPASAPPDIQVPNPLTRVSDEPSLNRQGTRARGTRFALDSLPDDWRQTAKELRPDLDPDEQFEKFADYWRATGKVRVDWHATWRNWLRREKVSREVPNATEVPWWKSRKATLAKGAKHGIRPEDYVDELGREDTRAYAAAVMQAEGVPVDSGSAA